MPQLYTILQKKTRMALFPLMWGKVRAKKSLRCLNHMVFHRYRLSSLRTENRKQKGRLPLTQLGLTPH